jgi:hypothetical protein
MNIDNCISSRGSHYDISLYIYENLKILNFEYKNNDIEIIKYLKNYIKSVIVNDFIKKSLYYAELNDNNDGNDIKSIKLLEIANKLKNEKFLKDILKELRQFYF